jgi:hypothetical protein
MAAKLFSVYLLAVAGLEVVRAGKLPTPIDRLRWHN